MPGLFHLFLNIRTQFADIPYFARLTKTNRMKILERFKYIKVIRSVVYGTVGMITYPGLVMFNKIRIEGTEHLRKLPRHNVLFVSNHQTYFADVIASYFLCGKMEKAEQARVAILFIEPLYQCIFCCSGRNHEWIMDQSFFQNGGCINCKKNLAFRRKRY